MIMSKSTIPHISKIIQENSTLRKLSQDLMTQLFDTDQANQQLELRLKKIKEFDYEVLFVYLEILDSYLTKDSRIKDTANLRRMKQKLREILEYYHSVQDGV